MDIDAVISEYGIKCVQIVSGDLAIEEKLRECDLCSNYAKRYWCELSWGSGEEDQFDFAYNGFGDSLAEAVSDCLAIFHKDVRAGKCQHVAAAQAYNIYEKILSI